MKQFMLFAASLLGLLGQLSAQNDFGAVGSYWQYTHEPHNGNGDGFAKIKVVADTLVGNEVQQKLEFSYVYAQNLPPFDTIQGTQTKLMLVKNDSVFINEVLILDFSMQTGDTLDLYVDAHLKLTTDSIVTELINGVAYQKWHGQKNCVDGPQPGPYEEFVILENIGQVGNEFLFWNTDGCLIGGGQNIFSCYKNGNFTYPESANCEEILLTNKNVLFAQRELKIHPNPATNLLHIAATGLPLQEIEIVDLTGRVLLSQQTTSKGIDINVADLDAGVYFVKIRFQNGQIAVRKCMKL